MASLIILGEPDISVPYARGPSYALGTLRVELEEQSFRAGLEETFRVELEEQSFRAGLEENTRGPSKPRGPPRLPKGVRAAELGRPLGVFRSFCFPTSSTATI